jgi:Rrf2 family transcriptional regulator, cysteine metabolism repressor
MNFTAKEDYGIRAVVDIAIHRSGAPIQAREIASRQGIPEQFLEQVLAALRRAGVVRSIRGAAGGYDLAKPAHQTTVGEILRALSGPVVPIQCVNEDEFNKCEAQGSCTVSFFWCKLKDAILGVVDGTTVQDMVDQQSDLQRSQSFMMNI